MPHIKQNIVSKFFSAKGRLSRPDFWILFAGFLFLWGATFAILKANVLILNPTLLQVFLTLLILSWILIVPIGIRRLQDIGFQSRISSYTFAGSALIFALFAVDDTLWGIFSFENSFKYLAICSAIFAASLIFNIIQWSRPSQPHANPFGPSISEATA